jgi:phosphoribosylformylglycinamidine synthase
LSQYFLFFNNLVFNLFLLNISFFINIFCLVVVFSIFLQNLIKPIFMIIFFYSKNNIFFAVHSLNIIDNESITKLNWLFDNAICINEKEINKTFIGPRAAMVTPWSTNAVEITQNMGISGIIRIEVFQEVNSDFHDFDPMLFEKYSNLNQSIFDLDIQPKSIEFIENISEYNLQEGLALSPDEIIYLENLSLKLNRKLTDSEIFGFSQVNSEHCRHKIFNGTFIIDGKEQEQSLFKLIKKTSQENPNTIISAYKDNVAFIDGFEAIQFAPKSFDKPDFYEKKSFNSVLSVKAETHNFPTTVEPFNGAATGSGGEIRDRLAGGLGSLPLAGTAVYMTPYSRLNQNKNWENNIEARNWLYQTPINLLIKASNGASDFGNKFGQPLISGSLLTFEHQENNQKYGYDKVIMLAGGIGYAKKEQALKNKPKTGDKIIVLGGDNYRIGMGGAAVSSANTGEFSKRIELNAVQRSNPEMQKRVANVIRAFVESDVNPIVSIHDHGAGGHLNCLSELVEETGGFIDIDKLPIGDPTLSFKEIIGNESQERIGLVIAAEDLELMQKIAERERAPLYIVGEVTGNKEFILKSNSKNETPFHLKMEDLIGNSPKTIMNDVTIPSNYKNNEENINLHEVLPNLLRLEAVACKDWLTNKVDRCVGGRVAKQQCTGSLQLPLNNCGVMALDYDTNKGIATSIGHAPVSSMINATAGTRNAIAEALTNIVFAPINNGLKGVSLSANWMWACNNKGEDARLYEAVKACSEFAIELGINIPTGKDSLSMKQKYPKENVIAPGTVIISAAGACVDIRKVIEPVFQADKGSIYYINLSQDSYHLGGSSYFQTLNCIGNETPTIKSASFFKDVFNTFQELIIQSQIVAGHDVGSGGLITTLLEMCFAENNIGANLDFSAFEEKNISKLLLAENISIVFQAKEDKFVEDLLQNKNIEFYKLGTVTKSNLLKINDLEFNVSELRKIWFETSFLLDQKQTSNNKAEERYENFDKIALKYQFPSHFDGKKPVFNGKKPIAGIIREKGSNSEREMAHAMYLAGFEVKDIHTTDLISGRETLEDIQFLGAVGGFSNSDVLGSAIGWAGAFLYNDNAKKALDKFFERKDTLSVGICNGCQLFIALEKINPTHEIKPKMLHNDSHKHESIFTAVKIQKNNSVMLSSLEGSELGVWVSHGEGKFQLPLPENQYNIVGKYHQDVYPANPNGSDYNTAMLCDDTGRHLVMMPHIERSIFPWNWAFYPKDRQDEISPWIDAFVNARNWIVSQ